MLAETFAVGALAATTIFGGAAIFNPILSRLGLAGAGVGMLRDMHPAVRFQVFDILLSEAQIHATLAGTPLTLDDMEELRVMFITGALNIYLQKIWESVGHIL